jgi:hypothetical protein
MLFYFEPALLCYLVTRCLNASPSASLSDPGEGSISDMKLCDYHM